MTYFEMFEFYSIIHNFSFFPPSYMTSMNGAKFKVGHKRPYWRAFSYEYPNQIGYKERIINILEDAIRRLKAEKRYNPLTYNI